MDPTCANNSFRMHIHTEGHQTFETHKAMKFGSGTRSLPYMVGCQIGIPKIAAKWGHCARAHHLVKSVIKEKSKCW
jgi:hypothetical protein